MALRAYGLFASGTFSVLHTIAVMLLKDVNPSTKKPIARAGIDVA